MELKLKELTKEAFAPYGDVISKAESDHFMINEGSTRRFHDLASVQTLEGGHTLINIFEAQPLDYPLNIKLVERHPKGSQAFMPLSGRPYLVVVAPAGENPTPDQLEAFVARADQGVNYHAGTWHHPVLALEEVSDFLVVDRGGEGDNCDEVFFEDGTEIILNKP
ncbi:ureidoglycolate lyase [Sneathiella sp. P13V-1]|uniref:ureidoglycolate lyase n=1 Tax=Sneathiella sp. P13V-1 TaxID=2697366 RepID=UPI00187B33F3|nr:ureidoglycolate lyase [Sneathiella sp. P13V-1]MBE7638151.1 ureidoglycolate lyase [Sneathiella sp. P13V-1]